MKKTFWKITAIIFMILFFGYFGLGMWGLYENNKEIENQNICFYEICDDYIDAEYLDNLCTCYEPDFLGELKIAKQKYMGS